MKLTQDQIIENYKRLSDEEKNVLVKVVLAHPILFAKLLPGNTIINYIRSFGKSPE